MRGVSSVNASSSLHATISRARAAGALERAGLGGARAAHGAGSPGGRLAGFAGRGALARALEQTVARAARRPRRSGSLAAPGSCLLASSSAGICLSCLRVLASSCLGFLQVSRLAALKHLQHVTQHVTQHSVAAVSCHLSSHLLAPVSVELPRVARCTGLAWSRCTMRLIHVGANTRRSSESWRENGGSGKSDRSCIAPRPRPCACSSYVCTSIKTWS